MTLMTEDGEELVTEDSYLNIYFGEDKALDLVISYERI